MFSTPRDLTSTMLSGIVTAVAEDLADHWDAPALLYFVTLTGSDELPPEALEALGPDTGVLGPAWMLSAPTVLDGHPFDELVGRRASADEVGVVLASEAWYRPVGKLGRELMDDIAAHAGPDGRTEVRDVLLMLRDGTAAHAVAVRDGSTHLLGAEVGGRIPAALRRTVNLPAGLEPGRPDEVALRAWLHASLSTASLLEESAAPAPLPEGVKLGDVAFIASAAKDSVLRDIVPEPFMWLIGRLRAGPSADWEVLLAEMRAAPRTRALRWLLAVGSSSGLDIDDVSDDHALNALGWVDAPLFGLLFDSILPDLDELESTINSYADRGVLSARFADLKALGEALVAGPHPS